MRHVVKTHEEMTSVRMAEIRVILDEALYDAQHDNIEHDKILHTDSTVAALTIKDWFSTGNECNVPRIDFPDYGFLWAILNF